MRIALGVAGGIAAYKSAEILRVLQDRGVEVQVVMTRAAREFVTPLTFAALSGRKVISEIFAEASGAEPNVESAIEHIAVAQSVDALVIAPATANVIAKMAHGLADDFLTTLYLATKAPVIVAPAMNVNMWENPATQENLEVLRRRGVKVVDPDAGYLACGMVGPGRLASVEAIAAAVFEALRLRDDLKGETVLVTAGRTEEPLDAVRYLSNRSSGKMGYAVAEASRRRGAQVILVSGPTHLGPPEGVLVEQVRTTEEMASAVFRYLGRASVVVMTAAVADFRPAEAQARKIKKEVVSAITLERTRDILAEIASQRRPGQLVVGFAAETDHVTENAAAKLHAKRLDLIVANDVTENGAGFDVDTNVVTLLFPDGRQKPLAMMSKFEAANRILDEVVELRRTGARFQVSGARGQEGSGAGGQGSGETNAARKSRS
ncbi:MAG: bifunctional phosphopantothenoylcysteine decarboxylase/phosphopantothenate--cysteine ligase CoaBC [Acidobacteria bacterium]|nr:MAG: bifunctional phosphopantothenoylcysteine decarboxylase/phosphopantothenate--cysteine ligase CoaBC [Acidobacteriota bacterium]